MDPVSNSNIDQQLFSSSNVLGGHTYMGFDMSASMFGIGKTNWLIQTGVIVNYMDKNNLKCVQAFGWSSDNGADYGVIQCPLFISKQLVMQYMAQFNSGRMTQPSTFFSKLMDYLKLNNVSTDKNITVVFLTDGVICCGNNSEEKLKVKSKITELKALYPKTSIEIHVIDPSYKASDTSELKVGADVFNIAMDIAAEEKGSKFKVITKVIVHTSTTDSTTELNQMQTVDDNSFPFDGKIFPKKFIQFNVRNS